VAGRRLCRLAMVLAAFAFCVSARAEDAADWVGALVPPWMSLPVRPWPSAVRVRAGEQALHAAPTSLAPRRGSAAEHSLLPTFGAQPGPGCKGPWFHVGPEAWLCGDQADHAFAPPAAASEGPTTPRIDGLPFRYFFAGPGGARGYRALDEFDVSEPAFEFDEGFAVAMVRETLFGGERYGQTRRGVWVRLAEFRPASPSQFRGAELRAGERDLPFAWLVVDRATLFRRVRDAFVPTEKRKERFERVGWYEEARVLGRGYVRIDDDLWVHSSDLRHPTRATPPAEPTIAAGARWIDVELASQTLVAYEGSEPVFATLVSTGLGKPGSTRETPRGLHRIWVKLLGATMDNLEDENASNYYRIEDVPYVQFFAKGVGLHAAFWHRNFGHERSHGCVNLAPRDAEYLFAWTGPRLPNGWSAALPTRFDEGTLVRVR
jgi:lipoprotein-anchoring transpeptidase ErfK/SrfK